MFSSRQKPKPSDVSKADGFELNVRLSGPTLIKIFSIVVAVSFGAGVLIDNQVVPSLSNDVSVGETISDSCPRPSVESASLESPDPS